MLPYPGEWHGMIRRHLLLSFAAVDVVVVVDVQNFEKNNSMHSIGHALLINAAQFFSVPDDNKKCFSVLIRGLLKEVSEFITLKA